MPIAPLVFGPLLLVAGPPPGYTHGLVQEVELVHTADGRSEDGATVAGRCQGRYKANERDGMWVGFWPDGSRRWAATYVAGKRHALYMAWRKDGTLEWEESYRNGKRHGWSTHFADDGVSVLAHVRYVDDVAAPP